MEKPKKDFYLQLEPFVRPYIRHRFNVHVEGEENILDEPALYLSNHVYAADSLIFASEFTQRTGRPIRFGAKEEYFTGQGVDGNGKFGRIARWGVEHTGQLPVDRDNKDPRAFQKLQAGMATAIAKGDSLGLYPEGTRNPDTEPGLRIHKFQAGAARIALNLGIPIIPYAHVYDQATNSSKTDAHIFIGPAIMPEVYAKDPIKHLPGKLKADYLIQMVENRVADLGGMQQSGVYALRQTVHLPGKK